MQIMSIFLAASDYTIQYGRNVQCDLVAKILILLLKEKNHDYVLGKVDVSVFVECIFV